PASTLIIERDGDAVGTLRTHRDESCVTIYAIQIDPELQGQGIGSGVIQRILREADEDRVPVRLPVLKVNPAVRLYRRLAFVILGATETHYLMERAVRDQRDST